MMLATFIQSAWAFNSLDELKANTGPFDLGNQWLWLIGGAVLVIGVLAVMVIPRLLNYALGLTVLLLAVAIGGGVLLPRLLQQPTTSQAGLQGTPENIQVSNIQPTQFTVTWTTGKAVIGAIKYGTSATSLNQTGLGFDPTVPKNLHQIMVTELQPAQRYYVRIISGGKEYPTGEPLEVVLPGN